MPPLMLMSNIWKTILSRLRSGYTRSLEEEIARLRAENRALVNSILGLAGIPPMRVAAAAPSRAFVGATLGSPGRGKPRPYEKKSGCDAGAIHGASSRTDTPMRGLRRRSWQQIGRALEIQDAQAARRERESDTDTFPAPRNIVAREAL